MGFIGNSKFRCIAAAVKDESASRELEPIASWEESSEKAVKIDELQVRCRKPSKEGSQAERKC